MNRAFLAGLLMSAATVHSAHAEILPVLVEAKTKTLAGVMSDLRARSGIDFSLAPDLASDPVLPTIRERALQGNLRSLLRGYNYEKVWGADKRLKWLIVSGRNGSANTTEESKPRPAMASRALLDYEPTPFDLPEKYRTMTEGAVMAVSIPTDQLLGMAIGEKTNLDLPSGQFEVVHDNRFQHENGDVTWVGHLGREGKGYRVIITLGEEGSLGQVVTPEGIYNIDFEDGRNWLVDLNTAGFNPGSLEHDGMDASLSAFDHPRVGVKEAF